MTKLSERIEACTGDTTELAAEMLTFVTGDEHIATPVGLCAFDKDGYAVGTPINPLTDLNAIAALEREYLPEGFDLCVYPDNTGCAVDIEQHGWHIDTTTAPTEALARSAALVRALEVSRDV